MSLADLETNARHYFVVKQELLRAEGEFRRLEAAVECTKVQQEELTMAIAKAIEDHKVFEDVGAVLEENVPPYVLKEDIPNYVGRRSDMIKSIVELNGTVLAYETRLREHKNHFASESRTLHTLEAAKNAEVAHGNGLLRARERLTQAIAKETALFDSATRERERLESKLREARKAEELSARLLNSRNEENRRAKEAVAGAIDAVAVQKSATATAHKHTLQDETHVAEQEEWLRQLKEENERLKYRLQQHTLGRPVPEDKSEPTGSSSATATLANQHKAINHALLKKVVASARMLETIGTTTH